MTLKESTFLLVICSFIFNTESYLIWESPYSVNTHNVLDGFHAVSSHSFGWSDSLSHSHDPTNSNRQVLKVSYRQGSYSQSSSHRGAQFYAQPSGSTGHTKMTLSYDVYFDSHFSWVRGGKLPGLFGGSMTCSGHRDTDHCFSTRMMWRAGGDGECYAYIPHNQQPDYDTWCRDSHIICNSNSGQSLGRGTFTFRKNRYNKEVENVVTDETGDVAM